MRMRVCGPTLFTEERHQHHPRHVEGGDAGAQQGGPAHQVTADSAFAQRGFDDGVLGVEAGERWHSDDRQIAQPEGREGDWQRRTQPAVAAHVLLVVHRVDDRAGAKEQAGFEEAVGEQVHDREHVAGRAQTGSQHHVADLTHRGRRQRAFDVVFGAADECPEQQRHRADENDAEPGVRRQAIERVGSHDQIHTGGHHGGGVDQRGHRGGTLHRVTQPGLQWNLRGFGAGAQEQQQPDRGQRTAAGTRRLAEDLRVRQRAEVREDHEDRQRQSGVPDPVHHERLLGRGGRGRLLIPETDQQVGRQAHTFPARVQDQVVVGHHQQQHGREEEVEVSEKPSAVRVFGHVADRVDVDQRSDAGDQQHEADRQLVDLQREVDLQIADRDPAEQVLADGPGVAVPAEHLGEQRQADPERRQRGRAAEQVSPRVGASAAEQQDCGAGRGKSNDQPGEVCEICHGLSP